MNIISQALWEYYVNDKPVESYLRESTDIYQFLKMAKSIGKNTLELHSRDEYANIIREDLQKINRYYISNEGKTLMKVMPPLDKLTETEKHKLKINPNQMDLFDFVDDVKVQLDRESNIEAGYKCTIFNKYIEKPINEYDINYDYYINECYKIINTINNEN